MLEKFSLSSAQTPSGKLSRALCMVTAGVAMSGLGTSCGTGPLQPLNAKYLPYNQNGTPVPSNAPGAIQAPWYQQKAIPQTPQYQQAPVAPQSAVYSHAPVAPKNITKQPQHNRVSHRPNSITSNSKTRTALYDQRFPGYMYTIKPGDTLSTIMYDFNLSASQVNQMNNFLPNNPNFIEAGKAMRVAW